MVPESYKISNYPGENLEENTLVTSGLSFVIESLQHAISQWTRLDVYHSKLLTADFMDLKEYSKQIFDDGNFTRSRKYFWAIGCLSEFDVSIADNIKQWDLYYEAQVKPLLEMKDLSQHLDAAHVYPPSVSGYKSAEERGAKELEAFMELVTRGKIHRESFAGLQKQFKNKLETVKSLRDGVSAWYISIFR